MTFSFHDRRKESEVTMVIPAARALKVPGVFRGMVEEGERKGTKETGVSEERTDRMEYL